MVSSWSLQRLTVMIGVSLLAAPAADAHDKDGPVISPSQSEIILQYGQNYKLTCTSDRPIQFLQQSPPEESGTSLFRKEYRNLSSSDGSEYRVELELLHVDRDAVGYYACFDGAVAGAAALAELTAEPPDTENVTYIYVFVNETSMFAPMRGFVVAKNNSKFVVECRPTTPDISVNISLFTQDRTPPNVKYSKKIGFIFSKIPKDKDYICTARRGNQTTMVTIHNMITPPPTPVIDPVPKYFLEGETFTVNCSVNLISSLPIDLNMTIPGSMSKVKHETNENSMHEQTILYKHYIIERASKNEAGKYICTSGNSNGKSSAIAEKIYLEKAFINMRKSNDKPVVEVKPKMTFVSLAVSMAQYPPTTLKFFKDSVLIDSNSKKVHQTIETYVDACQSKFSFNIHDLNIEDSGNYTLVASNPYISKNATFDIRIIRAPVTEFATSLEYFNFTKSTINTLSCKVTGYPLPVVRWWFNDIEMKTVKRRDDLLSLYKVKSRIDMPVKQPGTVMCSAENAQGNANVSKKMIVYEIGKGLGIRQKTTWFSEGDPVVIECLASIYEFINVTWYGPDNNEVDIVDFSNNTMSLYAVLRIDKISVDQAGRYACVGVRNDFTEDSDRITIDVEEAHEPVFEGPGDVDLGVLLFQPINLTCLVDSVPPPHIEWYKDGVKLPKDGKINEYWFNKTQVESNVTLKNIEEDEFGKYECRVLYSRYKDMEEMFSKSYNIILTEKPSNKNIYFSVLGVIFLLLIILVVYLTWKIKKEKRFRKELAAAGLLNFKEGATKSLNPDLGIDEQAELLPYDEKFEFSASRLILGKQLGAGAFGVVYKAEARGIVNAEETTIVAVKMVKKTADNMYIKALASELKIMVHLGKHVNIVNLLGACTKNVGKRELIVIVEYCKYGNIHNYMMKHREVFIDQLNDNPEKSMGKVNRGYSCSSANSGTPSDYFGMNHTQNTDNTFLNSGNTNRSSRKENQKQVEFVKASETGYVQPEWRSNYESDYSFDGRTPRPLCSRDLLAWAFQIARGMEYLASRKVLHGDLAARNILLADDNVVKICDFGLARNIYNNDEYQKKENSPLPVKWLAIECMTDRIFSTQSDVWSFGIVLWELFSLAKTPYPNVTPPTLLQWLTEGRRLERPQYADEKLYDVMLRCWDQKPTARPTFSQLQQTLGSFLEDNVRNHYVDLNMSYMDMNVQRDGEDYLAMVTAPDYNNMVTPSPHHYANEANFFPPTPNPQQLQHDDEGYLQMSPATRQNTFNARAQGTKFDFDARKLAPRAADASTYGSELTPMLTLNNLARSGSESDHEPHSPYMNMCPRIEEEADADEVFNPAANNARNQRPTAVTNPTYITFAGDQKQPLANSYININVPNGLVK